MGVTGLWRLIEPAGKPVPVETLENKVLAVDISIWLHQMVKGYQDAKGAPLPNAHLMGLFQRLCKLLYFRIKPVFVFDGGFPDLKKETIAKRQTSKLKYNSESERLKREIALLLGKKTAIGALLGKQISPKKTSTENIANNDDMFKLPALPPREEDSSSESEDDESSSASTVDLHSVDLESKEFISMPVKEKYDLLMELKETRKMNSWGKLHTLPKKSDNFSDFQMQRLLKRRKVQECIQETEQEMGDGGMSLNELESLLNEEGIDTSIENLPTRRIASNNTTRYLLINNVKQALAEAKKKKELEAVAETEQNKADKEIKPEIPEIDESDDELQKAIKMSLECVNDQDTSAGASKTDDSWTSFLSDSEYSNYADSEEEDGYEPPDMATAKAYIMQYSDFTHKAIDNLITSNKNKDKNMTKAPKINRILEELEKEKSVILENVELSSDEDDINNVIQNTTDVINISSHDKKTNNEELDKSVNSKAEIPVLKDAVNTSQVSVTCLESPTNEVITIDDSLITEMEEKPESANHEIEGKTKSTNQPVKDRDSERNSESSEDDFEEVSETNDKPVVQLSLNFDDKIEDDIFADVFGAKNNVVDKIEGKSDNVIKIIDKPATDQIQVTRSVYKEDVIKTFSTDVQTINYQVNKEKTSNTVEGALNVNLKEDKRNSSGVKNDKKTNIENIDVPSKTQDKNTSKELENKTTSDKIHEPVEDIVSIEKLNSMAAEIEHEEHDLLQEKGKLDRIGRNITEQMTKEAQELLQIFGIPYIVAPMEAEAQCAFLESVELTDGTITDDSDIWLFGGKTVYKNFFNQKKHVLQFLTERIEKSFNLAREQLVLLALLVGSDYTTGVSGVGPVTALEILASFPFIKRKALSEESKQSRYQEIITGLQDFKKWIQAGRPTDNISLKKKLRNVKLTDEFPSVRVVQAYLDPHVEKSKDKFTWGKLDITILRDYTKKKFGWSQNKLDEILKPVLSRMIERSNQRTVHDYFKRKIEFQSLEDQMSKRVKAAVQKMGPGGQIPGNQEQKLPRKRTIDKAKPEELDSKPGPSKRKQKKNSTILEDKHILKICTVKDDEVGFKINIPKTDKCQEIIPQREKDKKHLLENKLKAIEIFRKTKIDQKRKSSKRRVNLPKDKAELSESSDSN